MKKLTREERLAIAAKDPRQQPLFPGWPGSTGLIPPGKLYKLIGKDGKQFLSRVGGTLGGYRPKKIYGRLDCPSALRWLTKGQYAKHRVFFLDEATARAAGYRPCAICMLEAYKEWKQSSIAV